MAAISLDLDEELVSAIEELNQPIRQAARELIVMELYRLGKISRGRAAELLSLERLGFIQRASDLGIPYLRVTEEELDKEIEVGR
jgi:predicted HTH domain antitoxin